MRGALVGCGYVSQFHLRARQKVPGVRIEALCDLDAGRAAARAAEFSIARSYGDVARMLDEVRPHFLDVATRPDSHLSISGKQRPEASTSSARSRSHLP